MANGAQHEALRLEPLGSARDVKTASTVLSGNGPVVIGRGRSCEVCLPDPTVSRRHASLVHRDGQWFVIDLGGRQGTFLNGVKLEPDCPTAAAPGDFVRIGPYSFRLECGEPGGGTLARMDQMVAPGTIVERVPDRDIGTLAQRRLELLIDGAAAMHQASDEEGLGRSVVALALAGTGFSRAAVLRSMGSDDRAQIVASREVGDHPDESFSFSRSLLREASSGHIARLSRQSAHAMGQSIERLGITSALCAPIIVDTVVGYIYLDSREAERSAYPDAAGFCQAVSRLAGLALANLKRAELQKRQDRLEEDLKGAREAQAILCPPASGVLGGLQYAMRISPGRVVAGDLFDIFELDDHRVGVCFGDVSGQGMRAAIHMTAVVSHLRAALARHGDPAGAANDVNRYIAEHSPADVFVSLWVGLFVEDGRVLRYVDAGHGHWMTKRHDQPPTLADRPTGLLIGIDPSFQYATRSLTLQPRDRVILFSDGVCERTSAEGEQFGSSRVRESLAKSTSPAEDVRRLFESIEEFAGTGGVSDDTTVASIELC